MSEIIESKISLITEEELKGIDTDLHQIVNEFIKTKVKDKELILSQYVVKKLKEENTNLEQALIDIRKYVKSREYEYEDEDHSGVDYCCDGYNILQIIDKALGGNSGIN